MTPERKVNTVDAFKAMLRAAGLATIDEIEVLHERFLDLNRDDARSAESVTDFTSFLITAGVLTAWQAEKLRHGQYKGFFLEGHRLLDIVGLEKDRFIVLARHVETGAIVRLAVGPDFTLDEILPP